MARDLSSIGKNSAPHLAFRLCYDGGAFKGSQLQKKYPSVQQKLEEVLQTLVKKEIRLHFCSRTDSGVHAYDSVFYWLKAAEYFEGLSALARGRFFISLNALLAPSIQVVELGRLVPDFRPTKDVEWKEYRYRVLNSLHQDPLMETRAWWVPQDLDMKSIQRQIQYLKGTHDFSAFAKSSGREASGGRRACTREVLKAEFKILKHEFLPTSHLLEFRFRASGFLHHMVRNFVGTLVDIGLGKNYDIRSILLSRKRERAGRTAPAKGLYLYKTKFRSSAYTPLHPPKRNQSILY